MTDKTAFAALRDELERLGKEATPQRIMQTEFGAHGNCQSACLAMMLGLELADVPNFSAMDCTDNQKYAAQGRWLGERGLFLMTVVKWQALPWPPSRGFYIAGGPSSRGFRHSVIYKDGELWHDPHPDQSGITEVQDIDLVLPLQFLPATTYRNNHALILEALRVAEAMPEIEGAFDLFIKAVTDHVNEHGGGGYVLARLSDARAALTRIAKARSET